MTVYDVGTGTLRESLGLRSTHNKGQQYSLHPSTGYKSIHEIETMQSKAVYGEGFKLCSHG